MFESHFLLTFNILDQLRVVCYRDNQNFYFTIKLLKFVRPIINLSKIWITAEYLYTVVNLFVLNLKCPMIPPGLHGTIKTITNEVPSTMEEIEAIFPYLAPGGRFQPTECTSRHRVAIIVPYRDREDHLRTFLLNIHKFLQPQQLDYAIYLGESSLLFLVELGRVAKVISGQFYKHFMSVNYDSRTVIWDISSQYDSRVVNYNFSTL